MSRMSRAVSDRPMTWLSGGTTSGCRPAASAAARSSRRVCAVALGMGRPRAAGLLMMSGFYPMVRGWRMDPSAKRGMPAYITHGSYDPVIPVGFGRKARDLLEEGGLMVTFREARVQHSIDFALIPEIRDWVSSVITGQPVIEGPPSAR